MDISWDLYKNFYFVAKEKNFSRAAKNLFISQSAVSQNIKQLEEKLQMIFFIRSTKKVELTLDGKILFEYINQVYGLIIHARNDLIARNSPSTGEINIASTDTICKYHLLPKIKELKLEYPNIKVNIVNGTSPFCLNLLSNSKIDFAVINVPENLDNSKIKINKTHEFRDVFICSEVRKELIGKKVGIKTLLDYPLLVLDKSTVTRKFFDNIFLVKKILVSPDVELQSVDLLIEMAKADLGVSFVPEICVKNENDVRIIETKEEITKRQFGIVTNKSIPINPIAQLFIDIF